jgi:thiamine phosphate synthase YjbQ (UPF0047 family)
VSPFEATIPVVPRGRVDLIDVRRLAGEVHDHAFDRYPRCNYCSHHTTAGFLPQNLVARLRARPHVVGLYVDILRTVFPEGAGYRHDELAKREELTDAQRRVEPLNGDSHLAFIGGGLRASVTYRTDRPDPVYLIDLDGVAGGKPRKRFTTIVGYSDEVEVARVQFSVPVSSHPVDAVNLKDPRIGLYSEIDALLDRHGVTKGRVRMALASNEQCAALTVNEYETLLMRHDLAEVLQNPFRFAVQKARHVWNDPGAVPYKAIDYAKYDLVSAVNSFVDAVGLGASRIERILGRILAVPASHFLRTRRTIDLLVSDEQSGGPGRLIHGTYQAPLLLQWSGASRRSRLIEVTLTRFV